MAKKMPKNNGKHPGGRPPIEIDFNLLDNLCYVQCTEAEIAGILGVSIEVIVARIKEETGKSFSEYYAEKSSGGKASLRRRQFKSAMGSDPVIVDGELVSQGVPPNPTMMIWLGKQYLGQSDKAELTGKNGQALRIEYEVVDADSDT